MKLKILAMLCAISLVLSGCAGLSKKDYSAMVPGPGHGSVSIAHDQTVAVDVISSLKEPDTALVDADPVTHVPEPAGVADVGNEEYINDIAGVQTSDNNDGALTDDTDIPGDSQPGSADTSADPETSDTSSDAENTASDEPIPTPKPDSVDNDSNKKDRISNTYKNAKDDATDPYGYRSTDSLASIYSDNFDIIAPTSNMTFAELVGDNGIYNLPSGFPEPETYKIIVDKYYQVIMVFSKDENGDYTVPVRYMLCSTGTSSSPTRSGTFHLKSYRVRFGLFANTDVYGQYWSQIDGRMYFHSILYSKRDAASYTGSFNNLGRRASHGCIRLTVPDARWIWYNAAPGTTVIVRDGSSKDETTAAIKKMLTLDNMPDERPASLTGNDIPYTDNWTIDEVPHDVDFIQGSQNNS